MPREIERLLNVVDEGYEKAAWHGPNLRGSLRGVTTRGAAWRPRKGRRSIWEVAVHAAYWKYAVRRRILGDKSLGFAHKGSNWFARPDKPDDRAWRNDLHLLARTHAELRQTISELKDSELDRKSRGSRQTPRRLILGIAMHDVYHAGQIQLLKRLQAKH